MTEYRAERRFYRSTTEGTGRVLALPGNRRVAHPFHSGNELTNVSPSNGISLAYSQNIAPAKEMAGKDNINRMPREAPTETSATLLQVTCTRRVSQFVEFTVLGFCGV
jgi:hypothetical protein